jgi:hypothetical protein
VTEAESTSEPASESEAGPRTEFGPGPQTESEPGPGSEAQPGRGTQSEPGPPGESAPTLATEVSTAEPVATPDPLAGLPLGGQPLLSAAFDVLARSSLELRRASIYIGLLSLALIGPAAFLLWAVAVESVEESAAELRRQLERVGGPFGITAIIATAGFVAISVESQALAIATLAGRVAGRPLALHEALRRSRQVFWRIVRARILVTAPLVVLNVVLNVVLIQGAWTFLAAVAWAFITAPFVYWPTGIVIGDVPAVESLRRSVTMARVRWKTAVLLAGFSLLADFLSFFGFGVGEDLIARIATPLGLGPEGGALAVAITAVVIGALILALGSLILTVSAISNAPQVVAFLALTRYTGGLDQVREPVRVEPAPADAPSVRQTLAPRPPPLRTGFRWVTWPMRVGILVALVAMAVGLYQVVRV